MIISASINLDKIDKSKVIQGKKGNYANIVITVNDELDNYGNQGPIYMQQSKEERDAKQPKEYLGNLKVVWDNGSTTKVGDAAPAVDDGNFF